MALCVVPTFLPALREAIEQPARLFAKIINYLELVIRKIDIQWFYTVLNFGFLLSQNDFPFDRDNIVFP